MLTHDFLLGPVDTDSISFCKPDFSEFTKEEQNNLLKEINSYFPELIRYDHDGYYKTCIALKAKNYILQKEDGKVTYKGSSLKDQKTEISLKEFKYEIIDAILKEKYNYEEIYVKYIKEALYVKDIKRWSSKKTISEKTFSSERTNETKVKDAIAGTEYKEGDRVWVYFDINQNLKLVEKYNNDHDIPTLLKKVFTASKTFDNIIPKGTFTNFSLKNKKVQELLQELK